MSIAVVTGANRGLGFAVSEGLAEKGNTVIMTARDLRSLSDSAGKLKAKNYDIHTVELDVSDFNSIESALKQIISKFKRIDILVNNAGVLRSGMEEDDDLEELCDSMMESFQTNSIGPALMIKTVLPLMKKNNFGRIVNVSSGMGGLTEMDGGHLAYRASKAALNVVTRVYSNDVKGSDILINSVCPGWVKTEMGGAGANRELPEGAASILWAAFLPKDGPTGGFFRDGKALAW